MYSEQVMHHFKNPRNMGELENPDGIGEIGNPVCGDVMKITIKVKDNKIEDIKFKTFGCIAAIATTSMLTELAKGKTLKQAKKIKKEDIVKKLKGMPKIKLHCSVLGITALRKAIENYRKKKNGK